MFKVLLLVCMSVFLFGCNNHDFNLNKDNVICEAMTVLPDTIGGRYPQQVMRTTYKCYFSYSFTEDMYSYKKREKLKYLINTDKKENE